MGVVAVGIYTVMTCGISGFAVSSVYVGHLINESAECAQYTTPTCVRPYRVTVI